MISMIAAMGKNRVIGKSSGIPWRLPDDFRYFKDKTKGHYVLMGRKNFESLPGKFRPLPDRPNVIITRQSSYNGKGSTVVNSLKEAIALAKENNESEAFIIGGGEIYKLGLPIADRIYLTEIDDEFDGDTYFPEFNPTEWNEVSRHHHPADDRHKYAFDFVTYEKKYHGLT